MYCLRFISIRILIILCFSGLINYFHSEPLTVIQLFVLGIFVCFSIDLILIILRSLNIIDKSNYIYQLLTYSSGYDIKTDIQIAIKRKRLFL